MSRSACALLVALLFAASPSVARAQVFFASEPHPKFAIGPLVIVATVRPDLGPISVRLLWSVVRLPGDRSGGEIKQDLYLLWPGEIAGGAAAGAAEPTMARYVEDRGFIILGSGVIPLRRRDRAKLGTTLESDLTGVAAPFIMFYKRGTQPSQAGVGTWIKIPWAPVFNDPTALMHLQLSTKDLITPKPASWWEELFLGRRNVLTVSAGSVGSLALYSMYFEQRDRVVPLARDFSTIVASFADAEHLRIEEISPSAATRRPSRVVAGAETVALPLVPTEGVVPQVLKVQFSYFAGRIAWRPILVSALLLLLGNITGLLIFSGQMSGVLRRRFHVAGRQGDRRESGAVLSPETLARITPGETTLDEVVGLCGPPSEDHEHRRPAGRRTLVYRGTRAVPHRRFSLGRLAAVSHWTLEHHEVEIDVDGNWVHDLRWQVRKARQE
ncbi:MAG: hypothetical protein ACRELS_18730 [Candidatus Rokuibacteriota bacterium]